MPADGFAQEQKIDLRLRLATADIAAEFVEAGDTVPIDGENAVSLAQPRLGSGALGENARDQQSIGTVEFRPDTEDGILRRQRIRQGCKTVGGDRHGDHHPTAEHEYVTKAIQRATYC